MAGKKFRKDTDIAADFFSNPPIGTNEEEIASEEIIIPKQNTVKKTPEPSKKNLGGRPKKEGLKNEQFTLTMHPLMYEKLKLIATDYTRGNFSALIDDAIKAYCREMHIDLTSIEVEESKLDTYRKKQEKKAKKKK